MRTLPSALALATAVALMFSASSPVEASCAVLPSIAEAIESSHAAFVGTVVRLSNNDRWATVRVEEIWHGPDLAPVVEVRGGPAGNTASSVDRTYALGRYLFVISIVDGALHDSSCSATSQWTADLAQFRPATARMPQAEADSLEAPAPAPEVPLAAIVGGLGLAVVAMFGIVVVAARRRGPSS